MLLSPLGVGAGAGLAICGDGDMLGLGVGFRLGDASVTAEKAINKRRGAVTNLINVDLYLSTSRPSFVSSDLLIS